MVVGWHGHLGILVAAAMSGGVYPHAAIFCDVYDAVKKQNQTSGNVYSNVKIITYKKPVAYMTTT